MRSAMSDTGGLPPLLPGAGTTLGAAAGSRLRSAAAGAAGAGARAGGAVGAARTRGHGDVVAVAAAVAVGRDAALVVQVVGNRGVVFQHGVVVRAVQSARVTAEAAGKAFTPRPVDEVVID